MNIFLKLKQALSTAGAPLAALSGDMKTTICLDTQDGSLHRFVLCPGGLTIRLDQFDWASGAYEFRSQMFLSETDLDSAVQSLLSNRPRQEGRQLYSTKGIAIQTQRMPQP